MAEGASGSTTVRTVSASAGDTVTQTIWDGVYTTDQSERGARIARRSCYACHSQAEWSRGDLVTRWEGEPLLELYRVISDNMPLDAPGNLAEAEYFEIIAFMLYLNGAPPGKVSLSRETASTRAIAIAQRQ